MIDPEKERLQRELNWLDPSTDFFGDVEPLSKSEIHRIFDKVVDNFVGIRYILNMKKHDMKAFLGDRTLVLLDRHYVSPIFAAAILGEAEEMKRILSQPDIDVNQTRDDTLNTPLHYAAAMGEEAVVDVLLSTSDIDPSRINKFGESASTLAVKSRKPDSLQNRLVDAEVAFLLRNHPDFM